MNTFKVEYLITIENQSPLCPNVGAFNNLLKSVENVFLTNNTGHYHIDYKGCKFGYEIQSGEISNDNHRFFHIKLICNQERQLAEFEEFLRAIRTVLVKTSEKPVQTLWDDVSYFYADKTYPIIYEIENIMRKLITKFMLVNVGLGWASETFPQEVADSRGKNSRSNENYLYEVDFIQLSNFLFKEYTNIKTNSLSEKIRKAQNITDLSLDDLKETLPRSNWDRYFSSLIDCNSDYLRIRWEKLYDKRCQVAHNKNISRLEFMETTTLIDEIKPKLIKAIESLDNINISKDDRESVAENAVMTKNVLYGEFIKTWARVQHTMFETSLIGSEDDIEKQKLFSSRYMTRNLLNALFRDQKRISLELYNEILNLYNFRNLVVHQPEAILSDDQIQEKIFASEKCIEKLFEIIEEKNEPPTHKRVLKINKISNNTCTGRRGFVAIFKHFSSFESFLLPSIVHARLHAGNANRQTHILNNFSKRTGEATE